MIQKRTLIAVIMVLIMILTSVASNGQASAPEENGTLDALAQGGDNPYFTEREIVLNDGSIVNEVIINGPPEPPPGYEEERQPVFFPESSPEKGVKILNVPAYKWVYGCSAVSAAMIAAYYDINGYPNIYTGPTNNGVMPMDDSIWGTWKDGSGTQYVLNPLVASKNGLDDRTIRGSIDDYWVKYKSTLPDPFITGGWTEHSYGDAVGDYMHTSQSSFHLSDGSTRFKGAFFPISCDAINLLSPEDGTVGLRNFYTDRGYAVTNCYAQYTNNIQGGGFTFEQYKAEIDAGRPVLIYLWSSSIGHSIVGVGYDDSDQTVYLHDTWDYAVHEMKWGGSYSGMGLNMVSIVNMDPHNSPELALDVWRYTAESISIRNTFTLHVREPGTNRLVFESTVQLTDPSSTRVEYTLNDVWTGDYDIYLYNLPFLSRVQKNVHLVSGQETVLDFSAQGKYGDFNSDDTINYIDLGALASVYYPRQPSYWLYDLNGDGIINYVELGNFAPNYLLEGSDFLHQSTLPTNVKPTAFQLANGYEDPLEATADVNVTLSPPGNTYTVGDQFDVAVNVDTGGNIIKGSNFTVRYDSYALDVISVTDGGLFAGGSVSTQVIPEDGEILVMNTNMNATFNGSGTIFTIRFQVKTGGTNSGVWVYLKPNATTDSNIVNPDENIDLLAIAGHAMYSLTGSPVRPGIGGTLAPGSGVYISSYELPVELTLDANSSIIADSVLFEAYYDNAWHILLDDDNKNNGWGLNWDISPISDQVIQLMATVSDINNGSYSVESSAMIMDRIPPSTDLSVSSISDDYVATINWISIDNLSGVSQVELQYKIGRNGIWQPLTTGLESGNVQLAIAGGITHYIRARALDNAGNWSTFSYEEPIKKNGIFLPIISKYE